MQYSYKKLFFVDSLRILKTIRQQWTPTRRYLQNQPDWHMSCIVGMDKFLVPIF